MKRNHHKDSTMLGRSILEMLGVLALIGLLTLGGLFGYQTAINQYKANETIRDVMLRASNVPMKWENYQDYPEDEFLFPELGENQGRKSTLGYELLTLPTSDAEFDEGFGYVYKVEAPTIPVAVCEKILKLEPTDIDEIRVGTSLSDNAIYTRGKYSLCQEEVNTATQTVQMGFYFEKICDVEEDCTTCQTCSNGLCKANYNLAGCGDNSCENSNNPCCGLTGKDLICCRNPECCNSTDPCCGSSDPCCGNEDPCCGNEDPCCGNEDPCCGNEDPCCGNEDPCCGNEDPCCGSEDPCCGNEDPCCGNEDPCCGNEDPCCGNEDPCCGNEDPCCGNEDPCCGNEDPCCGNEDPCCGKEDPCCGSSDPCCGSSDPCCGLTGAELACCKYPEECCGSTDPCCGLTGTELACCRNSECCGSTDPCCGLTGAELNCCQNPECCGSDDPCCGLTGIELNDCKKEAGYVTSCVGQPDGTPCIGFMGLKHIPYSGFCTSNPYLDYTPPFCQEHVSSCKEALDFDFWISLCTSDDCLECSLSEEKTSPNTLCISGIELNCKITGKGQSGPDGCETCCFVGGYSNYGNVCKTP